jgi:hypothetical protein
MRISEYFGPESDYLVDQLGENTVTARLFDFQHQMLPDKQPKTASFDEMLCGGQGYGQRLVRLFLTTESQEVPQTYC